MCALNVAVAWAPSPELVAQQQERAPGEPRAGPPGRPGVAASTEPPHTGEVRPREGERHHRPQQVQPPGPEQAEHGGGVERVAEQRVLDRRRGREGRGRFAGEQGGGAGGADEEHERPSPRHHGDHEQHQQDERERAVDAGEPGPAHEDHLDDDGAGDRDAGGDQRHGAGAGGRRAVGSGREDLEREQAEPHRARDGREGGGVGGEVVPGAGARDLLR